MLFGIAFMTSKTLSRRLRAAIVLARQTITSIEPNDWGKGEVGNASLSISHPEKPLIETRINVINKPPTLNLHLLSFAKISTRF